MKNRVAYTNPHKHPEYIGGVMIPAGETREIDATHHPDYRPPESGTADTPQHIVDVLLAGEAANLLAHIPALGAEDLQLLSDREQEGARRKEVLSAIAVQLLTLASEQQDEQKDEQADTGESQTNTADPAVAATGGESQSVADENAPAAAGTDNKAPTAKRVQKAAGQ